MTNSILITGAIRGIGAALTEYYSAAGWQVYAACRSPEKAGAIAELTGVELLKLDVEDESSIAAVGEQLAGKPLDVLINNAGVLGSGYVEQSFGGGDTEAWLQAFRVNTVAPLRMVEAVISSLEQGQAKKVINISSIVASMATPLFGGMYHYRSTKAGLNSITVGLATDLAEKGISVASIHPGRVATEMGEADAPISPQQAAEYIGAIVDKLNVDCSGSFFSYDGSEVAW